MQSFYLAVGSLVPAARAEAGALVTQGIANPAAVGPALDALEAGATAERALGVLLTASDSRGLRQFGVIDAAGGVAHYSGGGCLADVRAIEGNYWLAIGNTAAAGAVEAMAESLGASDGAATLDRALAALAAGAEAGGDRRGQLAAAVKVVRRGGGYLGQGDVVADLRVDADPEPVARLAALAGWHRLYHSSKPSAPLVPVADLPEADKAAMRDQLARWLRRPPEPGDAGLLAALADFNLAGRIDLREGLVDAALPAELAALR